MTRPGSSPDLPVGTVTFLRTDVEGSMDLERALGPGYDALNAAQHAIVASAVAAHAGQVVRTEGDAVFAVFADALPAAGAAVDVQRAIAGHPWPELHPLAVRIGLHAGSAHRAGDDYGGPEVARAARVAGIGWGGQIVVSDSVRALIAGALPEDWSIVDLGSHRLKGIPTPERLFGLVAEGLRGDFPPLRDAGGPQGSLPQRLTSFVGRDDELEALTTLLAAERLLTLTGPGGTGKTSLAVEVARRAAARSADGAWFVDLQAVRDPDAVRGEIAHALGIQDGPLGPAADRLIDFARDRELLLVIDNFEQVTAAAGVIDDLLRGSPGSRVVVTSRIPLRLSAEQEVPIRPLALRNGAEPSDAVRLFLERARRVRPDLDPGPAELALVAGICRLVDGLPLAIELCAARVAGLPLAVLRDRLAAHLPLPGSGPRDLPERQRTIERTVDWSLELLDPATQHLFARLGVFEESFDLEQAEQVCGPADEVGVDVLDGLLALRDQSLLKRHDGPTDGMRFGMLETIRAASAQRLAASGEADLMRERLARAFADLADLAAPEVPGPNQVRWLDRLEADDANVRTAVNGAIDAGDAETSLRLVGSLWRYWLMTGRLAEGRALTGRAISMPGAERPSVVRARALDAAGGLAYWGGDAAAADAFYHEQLALARDSGDRRAIALALSNLTFTRRLLDDAAGSDAAMDEARRLYVALGDEFALLRLDWATALITLGSDREPESKAQTLVSVAERLEARADPWSTTAALDVRAQIDLLEGRTLDAARRAAAAFRLALAFRDHGEIILALQPFAAVLLRLDLADLAAMIVGSIDAAGERYGIRAPVSFEVMSGIPDPEGELLRRLGEEGFASAVESGRRMTLDAVLDVIEDGLRDAPEGAAGAAVTTAG